MTAFIETNINAFYNELERAKADVQAATARVAQLEAEITSRGGTLSEENVVAEGPADNTLEQGASAEDVSAVETYDKFDKKKGKR